MELKVMSLELLNEITNNFSEVRELGRGSFGVVYKGVDNGELIAVKLLHPIQQPEDRKSRDGFISEFQNLWRVSRHQNIIQLLGYCYETKSELVDLGGGRYGLADRIHRALCYEYMHNRSLRDHLYDEHSGHNWQTRYKIIKGICNGLKYLHEGLETPMYHLDLKPENILLDTNMVPKIVDFGLSRLVDNDQAGAAQNIIGTRGYVPPEYLDNKFFSEDKFDIFSLGVVVIRIITGYEGYSRVSEMSSEEAIDHVYGNWRKRLQEMAGSSTLQAQCHQVKRCIEIALDCVRADWEQRPTIGDVIHRLEGLEPTMNMSVAEYQQQRVIVDKGPGQTSNEALNNSSISSMKFSSHPIADKLPNSFFSIRGPLDVVIVFAFDCSSTWNSAWYTVYDGVFELMEEKLAHFADSSLGYIYPALPNNTYTSSDMKKLVPTTKRRPTYGFVDPRKPCSKNMASGLAKAQEMISHRGHKRNGIILFFSDGLIHTGDFFDGADTFISRVPVHTFTLGGEAYSQGLQTIAENSSGGKFHTDPVPEWPKLSVPFSKLLDSILGGSALEDEKPPINDTAREPPLAVVIVYAFDCTTWGSHWHTVYDGVFWMVRDKLSHLFDDTGCMGYIYLMLGHNMYTSDLKFVDSAETRTTAYMDNYTGRMIACVKNMASGLAEANKMINSQGPRNGIILFFSDGLRHVGDFFDGAEKFVSKVPVHTFTLRGDECNHGLETIAANSPGGAFHRQPVPKKPESSEEFSKLLDKLLLNRRTKTE